MGGVLGREKSGAHKNRVVSVVVSDRAVWLVWSSSVYGLSFLYYYR